MKKILIIENEFQSMMAPILVLEGQYKEEQEEMVYKVLGKSQEVDWNEIPSYNVILVDLSLAAKSEMDGYAILNKIKVEFPDMMPKTAIITGNGKVEDSLKEKGIGMNEFKVFTKPLKYMLLKDFIDKVSAEEIV